VQHTLGYSAIVYGHIAMILGLGFLIGSTCNRFLIEYFSHKKLLLYSSAGLVIVSLVFLAIAAWLPFTLSALIVPCMALFAVASIAFTNSFSIILGLFPGKGGLTGALYGSLMLLGTALITVAAGFFHLHSQIPLVCLYILFALIAFASIRLAVRFMLK